MRIAIAEFRQETNSFNPALSSFDSFELGGIYEGNAFFEATEDKLCVVSGMRRAIAESGGEAIPVFSMISQSGGIVQQQVVSLFVSKTCAILRKLAPFDGVFVSLHGATQSTEHDDACGYILETIRQEVGDGVVIAISCDLHANITKKVVHNVDIICGYQTYPHEDYFETGYRTAKLGIKRLTDNRIYTAYLSIPMIVPASGYTTQYGGLRQLIEYAASKVSDGELYDFSIFQMQPWLDVSVGGSSIITISKNKITAEKTAVDLAQRLIALKETFKPDMYSIDEVIDLAERSRASKPIVLVDSADSTNAGAAGDSIAVIKRLIERNSMVKTAFILNDAPAANAAHQAGVGNTITVSLGGTKDPLRSSPITVNAYVKSLHDGIFMQEGPAGRGLINNMGHTAVLRIGNIDIIVCQNIAGNGDPQQYRMFGIEPLFYTLVVLKACTSFRSAYEAIAETICMTSTPGAASADLLTLEYKKLPRSFYPFNDLENYKFAPIIYAHNTD